MKISDYLSMLRNGFQSSFWVANIMELFERLAFYGQQIIFMIYMRNRLGFSESEAGQLSGIFGFMFYLLPVLGGTLADKWGYRKAFNTAFTILALGYFLIGSVGMNAFSGVYGGLDHYWLLLLFLLFTAFGGSFIKPSVLGTVDAASSEETRSVGFAIYYMIVNVGAFIGPTIAYFVVGTVGNEFVYIVSALSCFAMLIMNLLLYKEVSRSSGMESESLPKKLSNMVTVLKNFKFMIFLLIYSLYWIIFWQEYIVIPYYITDYINAKAPYQIIQSWGGAGAIVFFQIPVNLLTKRFSTQSAILTGFAVSSLIWMIIAVNPTIPAIIAGVVAFSIGEMIQAPRYYEYISEIAPPGQQALFQGYAFLPIAIARIVGDPLGGWLYQTSKASGKPEIIWYALIGVGVLATVLMYLYNRFARN
ncbi:MAG TPA: MFS transporter [Ignavibacteriaceae bacterium]|nr:MFS transporter [Ignavibacteriaceae bacterium]